MRTLWSLPFLAVLSLAASLLVPRERSFHFEYAVTVKEIPTGAHTVDIWLPVPHDDAFQRITNLRIDTPYRFEIATGAEGNQIAHIRVTDPKEPSITVTMRFDAARKEHIQPLAASRPLTPPTRRTSIAIFVPIAWCRSTIPSASGRARWWTRRARTPIWKWRAPFTITWWPP